MDMDERPKWVKILKFISIIIPVLMVIYVIIQGIIGNKDNGLFIGLIFIVILILLGMWLFGFLIHYLVKKGKYGFALTIPILGFVGTLVWYVVGYIMATSGPYPSSFNLNMTSILVYLLPLIYFGVAWILVYRIRSKN